jgi:prohibitin 2
MEYITLFQPAVLVLTALGAFTYTVLSIKRRHLPNLAAAGVILLAGLTVTSAVVVTPEGHRGVVYSAVGGVQSSERPVGYSLIVPYFQSAVQMDVRTQKFFTDEAFAQSSDLQEITVHVAVNYHVDPRQAAELFDTVGRGYEEVVIRPAVFQLVKQEVGLVKAVDFATEREELANDIQFQLVQRLDPLGIDVEFVALEDAVFDPDFIKAVKDKVIADQEVEEQLRLVAAAEHRASQAVNTADGEARAIERVAEAQAQANRDIAASLTTDLLLWQRLIQWSGVLPETYLGGSDPLNAIIDLK